MELVVWSNIGRFVQGCWSQRSILEVRHPILLQFFVTALCTYVYLSPFNPFQNELHLFLRKKMKENMLKGKAKQHLSMMKQKAAKQKENQVMFEKKMSDMKVLRNNLLVFNSRIWILILLWSMKFIVPAVILLLTCNIYTTHKAIPSFFPHTQH